MNPAPGFYWVKTEEMDETDPPLPGLVGDDKRVWVLGFDTSHALDEITGWYAPVAPCPSVCPDWTPDQRAETDLPPATEEEEEIDGL